MAEKNTTENAETTEGELISLRIIVSDDIFKKINVIALVKEYEGKRPEIVSKIISLAISHYYKEVTVPELQSLTALE